MAFFTPANNPSHPARNTITRHGKQPPSEKKHRFGHLNGSPWRGFLGLCRGRNRGKPCGGERRARWMPEVQNGSTSHQNARWQQLVSGITVLKVLHAWETRPFVRITRRGASKTGRCGRKSRLTWLASGSTSAFSKMYLPVTLASCVLAVSSGGGR